MDALSSFPIVDIVLYALILIFGIIGLSKGFIKSLMGLITVLVAFFLTTQLVAPATGLLTDLLPDGFMAGIEDKIVAFVEGKVPSSANIPTGGYTEEAIVTMLGELGLPGFINNMIAPTLVEYFADVTTVSASHAIATYLITLLQNVVVGFVVFILVLIVLHMLGFLFGKMFKFPGLNVVNRLLGLAFGVLKGVVIIWAVLYVVSLLPFSETITNLVANAPFATWLIENNPIGALIAGTFDVNAFTESLKDLAASSGTGGGTTV